ncbi:hypothetical protein GCM10023201_41130 [Actinomycetospora corticicola]|uniref:ANTAR domain-containing protein n=1 Tax=Actinomycetospora corticicola TaxID=663602 RepID=A0A7Y9DWJ0_9PSEU|nr:hypothetical protein [Actinomycetospora corticicola]NYD36800.1 hypothetical protein [Actinomycetospora corticicola]
MIAEVRDALEQVARDDDLDHAPAVIHAIARGARAAGREVLTLDDLTTIADELGWPP